MSPTAQLAADLTAHLVTRAPEWAFPLAGMVPSPSPTDDQLREGLDPSQVSPGLLGFAAIFALAVACVLLFLSLTRHMRKLRHNEEVRQREAAEAEAGKPTAPGNSAAPGDGAAPGTGD